LVVQESLPEPFVAREASLDHRLPARAARSARLFLGPVLLVCLFVFLEVQPYRLPSGQRITYPVFILIALALLVVHRRRLLRNVRGGLTWAMGVFGVYVVWIVASAAWSYYPFISLAQAVPVIGAFLLALCFGDWSPVAVAKSIVLVGAIVALCSWVMFLIAPSSAVIPDVVWRLNGPLMHSQRLALLMGMSLTALVSLFLDREPSTIRLPAYVRVAVAVLLAGTLFATNSRAFIVFTLVAVVLLVFVRMRTGTRVFFLVVAALVVALALLSWQDIYGLVARGTRDITLTGRIPLWSFTIDMIGQRPLQGFGFATFGTEITRPATSVWIAPHAHNTWLNAAFETGIVGAGLLTVFLIACLVLAVKDSGGRQGGFSHLLGPAILAVLCGTMGLLAGGRLTTPYALLLLLAASVGTARGRSRR
jgi:O-antigen ligase